MLPLLVGAGVAIAVAAGASITRADRERSFYPTVLVVIASYYVLFAVMSGESIVEELGVAVLFAVAGIAGAARAPVLVGAAIFLHGIFDLFHASLIANSGVPSWWPGFCASVDLLLGAWVVWLALPWRGRNGATCRR